MALSVSWLAKGSVRLWYKQARAPSTTATESWCQERIQAQCCLGYPVFQETGHFDFLSGNLLALKMLASHSNSFGSDSVRQANSIGWPAIT